MEAVFLRVAAGRSPVAMGALAGGLIGTFGLAAEWAWTQVWMPIPWTSALLPEAAIAGPAAAVAGGALGGFVGSALTGPEQAPGARSRRPGPALLRGADKRAALAGALVVAAVVAWGVPLSDEGPRSATMVLSDAGPGPGARSVEGVISIVPADAVGSDPEFVNITAWQGGGRVLDPLERIGTRRVPHH